MNYAEFKDHLIVFLWKVNDAQLIARLDSLITMADAELSRKLQVEKRHTQASLLVDALDFPAPADYHAVRTLTDSLIGELSYTSPAQLLHMRAAIPTIMAPHYSIVDKTFMFSGPFVATPRTVIIDYRRTIPDYQTTDTSWLADEFLDLYTYTVLKHSAPFLREDSRIATWAGLAVDALESAIDDSEMNKTRGVNASKPLPRQASVTRRR